MSDSFADLWASSAPARPTPQQPQKKSGSIAPPRRQQYDAFSILSASQPSNKPVTSSQPGDRQARQPQPASRGGDAFSDLFASSLGGITAGRDQDRPNMTMAERARLAQREKVVQNHVASAQVGQKSSSASLWDGLDTLARSTTGSPRPTAAAQGNLSSRDGFDFAFDSAPADSAIPSTSSPPHNVTMASDDWGLSKFTSRPSESRSSPTPASGSQSRTLWDLDESGSLRSQSSHRRPPRSLTTSPGDFDFGDREDGLLGGDDSDAEDTFGIRGGKSEHAEDDILGDLGRPMSHTNTPSPNPSTLTRSPVRLSRTATSPPPHITGQLVEMGFSPVDARVALTNTMNENGFDVQAAAELLLSQTGQEGSTRLSPHPPDHEQRRNGNRDSNQVARQQPPSRNDAHMQSSNLPPVQLDTTAEKLLSQASEIGRGMFSKANALWKEGKERAVKMYEERAAVSGTANGDGRPRWMRDQANDDRQRPGRMDGGGIVQDGFKDDDGEVEETERSERQRPPAHRPPQSQPPPAQPERGREVDLFSTDSPTAAYQSPFRHGKPKTRAPPSSLPSSLPASTSSSSSLLQQLPQPPRTFTTTISLSMLTASTSHKSAGTDAYKRGDFPVALAAYIRALSALPPEHILRVPILTNVALVRSKVGELRDAIKACEEAVTIVRRFVNGTGGEIPFSGAESAFEEKTPLEVGTGKVSVSLQDDGGATSNRDLPTSVDLIEGLLKAFRRRAEALEGLEKWEMARSTWEVLLGAEWAGASIKGEAVKGVGRCRRMVDDSRAGGEGLESRLASSESKPKTNFAPRPRPKPTSNPSTFAPPSAALSALRDTHSAQQTEDAARLACKDSVDARLTAWKAGREGNIRALLTSLDETILWPELGWRKVGMAEVVSKGQVKGAYVRAIARVHPDKLNAGNTTVEQRMVANGVFGALNEAWNAFQQQQQ